MTQLQVHLLLVPIYPRVMYLCNYLCILVFNVHGSAHRKNIVAYMQQDATLHSLFYPKSALHVSGGTITHYQ